MSDLTGYQAVAAELHRIADAVAKLPTGDKPPFVTLSILPEHTVDAVDAVALAVLGKTGTTRRDSDGWRHKAESRISGPVGVSIHSLVPGPPDERDLELDRLRAQVAALRASAVLTPDADALGLGFDREALAEPAEDMTVTGRRVEPHFESGREPVDEHYETRGWTGGDGGSGVECACGVTYDGFDSLYEAKVQLSLHLKAARSAVADDTDGRVIGRASADEPGLIVGDKADEQRDNANAAYERDEAEFLPTCPECMGQHHTVEPCR